MQRVIRPLTLALALVAIIATVMPVTAAAAEVSSDWVELLEAATVNDSGNNLVALSGTAGTFRIKTPQYMRCTKVDLILTHPSGFTPTAVKLRYNNTYYTLTMQKIDAYTTRAYSADIPDTLYADLVFQITKSGTGSVSYQILSCKVTSLTNSILPATAFAEIDGTKYDIPFAMEYDGDNTAADVYGHFQYYVAVTDWQKYDKITISGSCGYMALNGIRATIGGLGLPYEMTYAVSNTIGSDANSYTWNEMKYYTYDESYKGTSETESFIYDQYGGKILYTLIIDLSGVDRTSTQPLYVWFTTLANQWLGYSVQFLGVTGQLDLADTSSVSWWDKVKAFFTDLLGSDSSAGDDYKAEMESQAQEMEEAVGQMEQVTRPPVEDVQTSVDEYVNPEDMAAVGDMIGGIMGEPLVLAMVMISLILSLAAYVIFGKR